MHEIKILGKYLDQPMLVGKLSKRVPLALIIGTGLYAANSISKSLNQERRKKFKREALTLVVTSASALLAPRAVSKLLKTKYEKFDRKLLTAKNTQLVDNFMQNNNMLRADVIQVLHKAKGKILKFSEVKILFRELDSSKKGKIFLEKLIPSPENIDSKHIFSEIKKLSLLGLFPVLGGIAGGILGDYFTSKKWRDKIPDKVKEGSYQYLANIFLCNVGAGFALWIMEKAKVTSKGVRAIGMILGIVVTGIVSGSAIANLIGKHVIDPLFGASANFNSTKNGKKIYDERKPELLDVGLHIDDIATVGVMSGLKWIEPILPVLYFISGYRAGIGYRNGDS